MQIHAVPQWQGALTMHARRLSSGCRALAKLAAEVLDAPVVEIDLATDGSPVVDGIANRNALVRNHNSQRAALTDTTKPVLTIGGDCGVELAPLAVARHRHGDGLTALWFDAHPDLNTPASSASGAFHGMVLRAAFGDGEALLRADPPLAKWRAILAGARSFDAAEAALLPLVQPDPALRLRVIDLVKPENLGGALDVLSAHEVYLHIDLDVLDPTEFHGLNWPEPDGITIAELAANVSALADGPWRVIGAGITECVTDDAAELRRLTPLLAAVGAVLT